ncbi:hypothetical protein RQP46_010126 [Phenoliferia psychrophenolica]
MSLAEVRRKLTIVGDGACGKTCLLVVFKHGKFPREYTPTVFENYVKDIRIDDRTIELALWDTAGQEDYDRLRPLSYPDTDVVVICFSLDSPDSLDNVLSKWEGEVHHHCRDVPILLVGCKKDLREDPKVVEELRAGGKRPISWKEGEEVRRQIGAKRYLECSALTGEGVHQVFDAATRLALAKRPEGKKPRCRIM